MTQGKNYKTPSNWTASTGSAFPLYNQYDAVIVTEADPRKSYDIIIHRVLY